ncbi:MAG: branched-chain amino acid ABC transporter permease [Caldilineae bacterium]|nr:MAG: branched-chain amino acid ABC transporter permease [Caldilineae bacterium]
MSSTFLTLQILNGITFGALLFLVSSGFTLIFGLMRVANLTHGVLYLLAGYIGLSIVRATGNFVLAIAVAALFAGVLGLLIERTLLHRVQGQVLSEVLLTIGIAFILADVALMQWGGDPQTIRVPHAIGGPVKVAGITYPRFRIFTLGVGIVIAVLLWVLQHKTRIGAIVRAGVDDAEMVSALGINIPAIFSGVFFAGAMLAGIAGVVGGGFLSLYRGADSEILLFGLVVVIIGGMGSLEGAIIGSLVVGLLDSFGKALYPEISYFTIFGPMAIILALRPRGLFGRKS